MSGGDAKPAQAGTLESMDCLVTIERAEKGRMVEISGSGATRFRSAMTAKVNAVLDTLSVSVPVRVHVQDNGAQDIVLGARVEAAYRRFAGGVSR